MSKKNENEIVITEEVSLSKEKLELSTSFFKPVGLVETENVIDFEEDAGNGTEEADKSSFAIPYLSILQKSSPQCDEVEGSSAGLLINTITNEVCKSAMVIPCHFQRRFCRFIPREKGKGYKGAYNPVDIETGKIEADRDKDGNYTIEGDELIDTRLHYVLVKNSANAWQPILMSLRSTHIKKSREWLTQMRELTIKGASGKMINPASYSHIYKVSTTRKENSKGVWWVPEIEIVERIVDRELYLKAKAFHKSVSEDEVVISDPTDQEVQTSKF